MVEFLSSRPVHWHSSYRWEPENKQPQQLHLFAEPARKKNWKFLSTALVWGEADQKPDFLSKWTVPMSDRIKRHRQT
jgi:hypothetical protein